MPRSFVYTGWRSMSTRTSKHQTATHTRPSWDDYFMAIARIVSTRATCDRLHSGAVLVRDSRIISTGYNGAPPGLPHCDDDGHLLEDGHCVRTIHGEHNVILQAAAFGSASTRGSTLYTVYSPCIHCAKYVVAAGITRVVAGKVYRNKAVTHYLEEAGIRFELYTPTPGWYKQVSDLFSQDISERSGSSISLISDRSV